MYNRVYQRERRKENKRRKEQAFNPQHSPDYKYMPEKGTIAGIKKGDKMSFEQANGGAPNPLFQRDARFGGDLYGYTTNCQTCVVAFEARQRGYDVRALPNNRNPYIKDLAYRTNLAYLDANGNNPSYKTPKKGERKIDFIGKTVKDGRYTLEFSHGKGSSGHIVSLQRINGEVVMYDPQTGDKIVDIKGYLSQKTSLKILRVDNCDFDPQYVNYILKGVENGG